MVRSMPPYARSLLATMLAILAHHSAQAQQGLEEVIVTAQKRTERAQDVPIALAAFGGDKIKELAIGDLRELSKRVPGVALFDDRAGSSQPTWVIRGVGLTDFNANNTPTAAIYYDEFYMTSNVMGGIGMFDIDRVEILKGPQGGLYGRNTTGGAVRVESVRPSLESFDGYATARYGKWGRYGVEGAAGGPLSDTVAFRIAGMIDQGGGWQDSLATAGDDEWGDHDFYALRARLLFQPSESLQVNLKIDSGKDQSETVLGSGIGAYDPNTLLKCAPVLAGERDDANCVDWGTVNDLANGVAPGLQVSDQSGDGREVLTNPVNQLDNEWFAATVQIDWDLEDATLTSITGYIDYEMRQFYDYDAGVHENGHENSHSPIKSWSQELRLVSNADGPFEWLAAVNWAEDELDDRRQFLFADNLLVFGGLPYSERSYLQTSSSWAAYGQVGYRLNDALKLHGSLRYTDEQKDIENATLVIFIAPGQPLPGVGITDVHRSWQLDEHWTGHAGIDWTPSDNALLYAKVTRGFKSGGFFGGFALTYEDLNPYIEETIWSYEAGFKTDWFDNSLRLNGAVYYYDYTDAQGYTTEFNDVTHTALTRLGNLGDAEHVGAELDFIWSPVALPGATLSAGAAWLDAEFDSKNSFLAQDFTTRVSYDGLQRSYAPEFSYDIEARYEWDIGADFRMITSVNYAWRDDVVNQDTTGTAIDAALYGVEAFGLLDARLQIGAQDDRWHVALVGKNLMDEEYVMSSTFDNLGSYMESFGLPFSWMLELNYNWR